MNRDLGPFVGDRIILRLLREEDLSMTRAWRNQDHIRRWFFDDKPVEASSHQTWFSAYCRQDDAFVFIIEETESLRRPIGQIGIDHIDWQGRSAEIGRLMIADPSARSRGLAKEAVQLLVSNCETQLDLCRLTAHIKPDNASSIAVFESVGFVQYAASETAVSLTRTP